PLPTWASRGAKPVTWAQPLARAAHAPGPARLTIFLTPPFPFPLPVHKAAVASRLSSSAPAVFHSILHPQISAAENRTNLGLARAEPRRMVKAMAGCPAKMGFRMPAEWEPHEQCWMGWPERPDNWREHAEPARKTFERTAMAISKFEPVTICASAKQYPRVHELMEHQPNIRVVEMSMNDSWFRDTGPTFITREGGSDIGLAEQTIAGIDWEFNAWGGLGGGCFDDWSLDRSIAKKVKSEFLL
uniref:Agmatine deiminase n=1 Tax=Aegilops tauschii subsp. strangulata TaxID=200361 RepID=A0A453C5Z1_AEGTS